MFNFYLPLSLRVRKSVCVWVPANKWAEPRARHHVATQRAAWRMRDSVQARVIYWFLDAAANVSMVFAYFLFFFFFDNDDYNRRRIETKML